MRVLGLFAFTMKKMISSTEDVDRAKHSWKEEHLIEERWPWG